MRAIVVFLFLVVAAGGVLFGPALAADLTRRGGALVATRRKFEQLRSFALFRSRGDRAVVRWGEPPGKARSKKSSPASDGM